MGSRPTLGVILEPHVAGGKLDCGYSRSLSQDRRFRVVDCRLAVAVVSTCGRVGGKRNQGFSQWSRPSRTKASSFRWGYAA